MATRLEGLVVQLSADVKKYENALARAMGQTNRQARSIERRFTQMNRNISASFADTLKSATAIAGVGLGTREIIGYADAWTQAGNMIRAAATSAGVQTRSLEELNKGANDARTSLTDYADLYARLIRSASAVAKSEDEIALATSLVSKAFKAGGASAQEQAAGILQLGQALGSGVLQGDELRSIRENAPVIAKAIADEFKVSISGLKKLGEDGKLTSDRVFKAILNAQKPIEAQFKATNATIGDSFIALKNNLTQYIGQTASAYGVTETINKVLGALAGNIESVANAAAAAGLVLLSTFGRGALIGTIAALANPFVAIAAAVGAAAYAVTQFKDTIVPLQGSVATLGDYLSAMWDAIAKTSSDVASLVQQDFNDLLNAISQALAGVNVSMSDVLSYGKAFVNGFIEMFVRLKDVIVTTFTQLPQAIAEATINAMNAMIEAVEAGVNKVVGAVNSVSNALNTLDSWVGVSPTLGDIGTVDLGRLTNTYAGAGEAAGKAYGDALTRESTDYVGKVVDGANATLDALTARANQLAAERRAKAKSDDLKSSRISTAGYGGGIDAPADDKKKKKRAKRTPEERFDSDLQRVTDRTAALVAETEAQRQLNPTVDDYGYAMEKARTEQELLNQAQKAGVAITPQLKQEIAQTAEQWALASAEAAKLAEEQDKIKSRMEEWQSTEKDALKGIVTDLVEGKSAAEAFSNALSKIADKLLDMAFDDLFTSLFKGGSNGGSLTGLIGSIFRFANGGIVKAATGGYISGPGGPRADKVPAMLSNGEYVINAAATKKYGPMLDAINSGKGLALAGGGPVLRAPTLPNLRGASSSGGGGSFTFAPQIDARGADVAAVARLEQVVAKQQAEFEGRVVATMRKAKSTRNWRG